MPWRWGLPMKAIVILLALLVAAKLGHQEYLYRASTREAIIGAYKERAVHACQKDARSVSLGLAPQAWSNPSVKLVIGKGTLDVQIWQVDHEMWNARYRNAYLFLTPASRSNLYCEYDIVNAAASVYRM
jgi:hypothetical protein